MGFAFWGNFFLAFGPSIALVFVVISSRAQLAIILVISSFLWLVSALLSSIFWIAIPPLKEMFAFHVILGVIIQEVVRMGLFSSYVRVEKAVVSLPEDIFIAPLKDFSSALAAGVGFGCMHASLNYGSLLSANTGPGTYYIESCPQLSIFTLSAFSVLLFQILHIGLMIVSFYNYRIGKTRGFLSSLFLHLAASASTLANTSIGCSLSLPLLFIVVVVTSLWSAWITKQYISSPTSGEINLTPIQHRSF